MSYEVFGEVSWDVFVEDLARRIWFRDRLVYEDLFKRGSF